MPRRLIRLVMACVAQTLAVCMAAVPAQAANNPLVREEHALSINGARETWQLIWDKKPATMCAPEEDADMALTCPCSGWAYGESGKLSLVRVRNGRTIDKMDMAPLFGKFDYPAGEKLDGSAYLQRWPAKISDMDGLAKMDPKLVADIKRRPAPTIMKFADYDRDGQATEFLVQVGTLPCGKHEFAAIGLTRANPRLHALATATHPHEPLMMPIQAWEALLKRSGPTEVLTWECGDHASERRNTLVVSAHDGAIQVKAREYSCPEHGGAGQLLGQKNW